MTISELIEGLGLTIASGDDGMVVRDVTDDSRACCEGCLFVARSDGGMDGARFIEQAIGNGAAGVVCEEKVEVGFGIVKIQPRDGAGVGNGLLGQLAEKFYGYPSRHLSLIGVTGTNGKTTIAHLVQQLLQAEGVKTGLIGTVCIDDGGGCEPAKLTTPGAAEFSRLLGRMVGNGCKAAVAEVSSHALEQGRVAALDFNVAVFTNLTQDHLDYHKTMDAYAQAKARLFRHLGEGGVAVVNADDGYAAKMIEAAQASGCQVIRCSLGQHRDAECTAEVKSLASYGSRVEFDGPWGFTELTLPMVGEHNVSNALLAAAAAQQVYDLTETIDSSLAHCQSVPGRLEVVSAGKESGHRPTVLVDYAHTPDALENVLTALRKVTKGKLWVMFGCGGDRDRAKRPIMGELAVKLADGVVVTSDNPRTEQPQAIIDDIMQGISAGDEKVWVEVDRRKAIELVISKASEDEKPGVVLLAGKGHEDYQVIGTERVWFDDRVIAREILDAGG